MHETETPAPEGQPVPDTSPPEERPAEEEGEKYDGGDVPRTGGNGDDSEQDN